MSLQRSADNDGFRIVITAAGSESAIVPTSDVTVQVHSITGTATVEVSAAQPGRTPVHWEAWDKGAVSAGTTAVVTGVKQIRLTTTGAATMDVSHQKVA